MLRLLSPRAYLLSLIKDSYRAYIIFSSNFPRQDEPIRLKAALSVIRRSSARPVCLPNRWNRTGGSHKVCLYKLIRRGISLY